MDPQLTKFKFYLNYDPVRAHNYVAAKASEYALEWGEEKVQNHSKTLEQWNNSWKTNQEFEKEIMAQEKWFMQDMKNMAKQHHNQFLSYQNTTLFYTEALE